MKLNFKSVYAWTQRYISMTFIIVVAFVCIVLFFNENSVLKSMEYNERITELKKEIKSNRDTLEHYNSLNHALDTDPEAMERIVRENYHMQRPNEDVFIVD